MAQITWAVCWLVLSGSSAGQVDRVTELSGLLPADLVAGYVAVPQAAGKAAGDAAKDGGASPSLLDRLEDLGLLAAVDACTRQWLDALGTAGVVTDYPHAVALLDVSATPLEDGGHRLASASAVLVVDTHGNPGRIARRIQHLLDTYTNSEHTTLSIDASGSVVWTKLRDKRLPDWVVIRWGQVGEHFVVTLGDRAFDRVRGVVFEGGRSLASEPWFAAATGRVGVAGASLAVYANLTELRGRVDPGLARKILEVQQAFRIGSVSHGLWVARRVDRALEVSAVVQHGSIEEVQRLAGRRFRQKLEADVIPKEATRYAVVNGNPRRIVLGIAEAYLASRSTNAAADSRAYWRALQEKSGVSIEDDILAYLDDDIVWHDFPPAVIDSALTRTMTISIKRDPTTLRAKVDQLLTYVRDVLLPPGLLQLRRDDDGVWYVTYGLQGPALTVLDDWVVYGFSPAAVRAMRDRLQPAETEASGKK